MSFLSFGLLDFITSVAGILLFDVLSFSFEPSTAFLAPAFKH